MKFTRIFLLKTFCSREERVSGENPLEVLKEVIVSHPIIDLSLAFILSFILLLTKWTSDTDYIYSQALNIYFVCIANLVSLSYYFLVDVLDKTTTKIFNSKLNNENITSENSNSQSLLNNPNKYNEKLSMLPMLIFDNWHFFKSSLHLFKIILTLLSYFLSIYFCILFSDHKNLIDKEKYFMVHLLFLEFYEFYSGFRVCYFFMKFIINILLLPLYFSTLILGYIEDRFNEKLNRLVNTKLYKGRTSIKSPPNGRVSELEEYCSICLNSFKFDEFVSTLPCSRRHTFHTKCLEKWFLTTVTCPLCRSDFHNSILILDGIRESQPFEQIN